MIQNTISKLSKPKIKLKKDPLKFQKIKNIYTEASNQKFYKTDPPKSGNSDSKYNFEIFKNLKSNSKKTLQISTKLKIYIRRTETKKYCKTDPPKVGILIQSTILKFSKIKYQAEKKP